MTDSLNVEPGALVFACGAKIAARAALLPIFPVGKRYIVDFSRDTKMATPKKDGRCMSCLTNCPAPVKKSGYQVERAWGADDHSPTSGFLVRCKVVAHDLPNEKAEARLPGSAVPPETGANKL